MILDTLREILAILKGPFDLFLSVNNRLYWLYWLTAFTIAYYLRFIYKKSAPSPGETRLSLAEFAFPKSIVFHRSAINDYFYFYTGMLFQAAFVGTLFSSLTLVTSNGIRLALTNWLPDWQGCWAEDEWRLAATLFLAIAADFGLFFSHYLQHKVPWLWEFHKVHHSAEVMTPITVYRMHPVDNMLAFAMVGVLSGAAIGTLTFFSANPLSLYHVGGTDIVIILFYIVGYNLRHSHVWWSWGPVISRILISPAQHQVHHSADPKHFDKNMGFTFAFWDAWFGTLYVPKNKEDLTFGLGEKENEKFSTFWSLYLMPFINVVRNFRPKMLIQPRRYLSALVFFAVVVPSVYLSKAGQQTAEVRRGVYLEDLTWQEVNDAIKKGSTTVLVPTGGTEQNGPHVVLGKHNYIVKYTAGKIAEKLTHALVAPVIAYVPEGRISPPEGHMNYAGTLSISEPTFEAVLESTAESLKQHGFKVIALVGDSGGNQAAQKNVAERLNRLFEGSGVRVLHLSDYYLSNGQTGFLENQGYSPEDIGSHAGIRDTSELMFVNPEGVRNVFLQDHRYTDFEKIGANGDASKASVVIGQALLDLKIDAAVKQIRQFLTEKN